MRVTFTVTLNSNRQNIESSRVDEVWNKRDYVLMTIANRY